MTPSIAAPDALAARDAIPRFVRAGLVTAIIDGAFSSVLSVAAYGSSVSRLFQGVAATVLGSSALTGGAPTVALGVLLHVGVAFTWSGIFIFVLLRSPRIRRALASRYGPLKVASVYGPCIWLVMSLIVIPLLLSRPPAISIRWWIQLVGHAPFVGLPIVATASGLATRPAGATS